MIRAVIRDGKLCIIDPLPAEWKEGTEIELTGDVVPPDDPVALKSRWGELEAVLATIPEDPDDDRRMQELIDEQRRISNEQVRRQMGLA